MSKRYGKSIPGIYFTTPPLSPASTLTDDGPYVTYNDGRSISHHNTSSNNNTGVGGNEVGTNDDDYLVSKGTNTIKISKSNLRRTLIELHPYSQVNIKDLPVDAKNKLNSIVNVYTVLYGTGAVYNTVIDDVVEIFNDVDVIIPGTLAAFLVGCHRETGHNWPQGCDPACASSLPPPIDTPGYAACKDGVLIYSDQGLRRLNNMKSTQVYIYITHNESFTGFLPSEIDQLRDEGVQSCMLVSGAKKDITRYPGANTYGNVSEFIPIDNLPVKGGSKAIFPASSASGNSPNTNSKDTNTNTTITKDTTTSSINWWYVGIGIAIIVLIIIIILLIFYFSRRPQVV